MAVKTIQIADKPTLDATKALLEDSEVGLAAIKQAASSGAVSSSAGGLHIEKYVDEQVNGCVSVSTMPHFIDGSAVVLNDEIHILGGTGSTSSYYTKHYKFNGSSWESVSTLPYKFYDSAAVVLNNEIHIFGGDGDSAHHTNHYKYNGTSWESVSTLPYEFYDGAAVVLNNEIHIFGSRLYNGSVYPYARKYYKFNGSSWIDVRALPYEFYGGAAVVLNNEIHICGGGSGKYSTHYLVRPDNRHIATMLPKGVHILLSDNEDIIYASNAKRISSNIAEVTDTGYVELLAALTEMYNIKGYLTFY